MLQASPAMRLSVLLRKEMSTVKLPCGCKKVTWEWLLVAFILLRMKLDGTCKVRFTDINTLYDRLRYSKLGRDAWPIIEKNYGTDDRVHVRQLRKAVDELTQITGGKITLKQGVLERFTLRKVPRPPQEVSSEPDLFVMVGQFKRRPLAPRWRPTAA